MSWSATVEHMRLRRFLDAHVDRELTDDLAARVVDHVRTCPRCGHDVALTAILKRRLALYRAAPARLWARHPTDGAD